MGKNEKSKQKTARASVKKRTGTPETIREIKLFKTEEKKRVPASIKQDIRHRK